MPLGMLTVGQTTRETAYAPVASSLGPRLARNLDRHQLVQFTSPSFVLGRRRSLIRPPGFDCARPVGRLTSRGDSAIPEHEEMAHRPGRSFHTASDAEIKRGEVSDVYFARTVQILKARGDRHRVKAEGYLKSLPAEWQWGVLAGVEEAKRLLAGTPGRVAATQ